MKNKILGLLAAAAAALLTAAADPAQADNLRAWYTTNSQVWTGQQVVIVQIPNGNARPLTFTNPQAGLVSVTFTAQCQLIAASAYHIEIRIYIDSTLIPPSGQGAFCSGRNDFGSPRHSITVAKTIAAGPHTVSVKAYVQGDHTRAELEDMSLLVAR